MAKDKAAGRQRPASEHLTVYLGNEGRRALARCQQLLADRRPQRISPSAGLTLRLALRRLLLSLLGERADWTAEADPIAAEYLDLVEMEDNLREIPVKVEVSYSRAAARRPGQKHTRSKLKGGTE